MDKNVRHHPIGNADDMQDVGEANLTIAIHQNLCCAQLFAINGKVEEVEKKLGIRNKPAEATYADSFVAMPIAPAQWMLVANEYDNEFADKIGREVSGIGYVSEQTHSRAGIRISGKNTHSLMERLCRLNLRAENKGFCASTPMAQVGTVVHQVDDNVFDIYIYAGYAKSFINTVIHTASQFGYEIKNI